MINAIIDFSIRNKLAVSLFMVAWVIVGIWSMRHVPIDAVPDITNNQVQIITQAPNLGTEDIEQFITYPVELAVANLPGLVEIRSISRFGLSVVTIVFEEDMGTYLPRQLVSEKLEQIRGEVPDEFGSPEMGPITTGLGEIYQYTIEVAPEFRDRYSATDLRTAQDWIIRRQMAMVPGVVEVNAFGGSIKQYQVAVNPSRLEAMDLGIADVFAALEHNNQNTGGAYIEKDHLAHFIRGEGLARSIEDIEMTVVAVRNGVPVLIRDIAEVGEGTAVRYGAFTKNGQGEAVGGMILMLKGANSSETINRVKDRMAEIEKSLPEGMSIVPFLDRSDLVALTTRTVSTNLMEGGLIVIFVLVVLLGNWRGGLIVASTIPLAMLFAFMMMHYFGVWANLMSLGAIDFGILVDGSVIIVESTVFYLHRALRQGQVDSQALRDATTSKASRKMMNPAFFGQLVIMIVFIPILTLEGVEGSMFKPMAMTFIFAILGVMILCLTYIPMMTAAFLRVDENKKQTWGDRFVIWVEDVYEVVLNAALKRVRFVLLVTASLSLFALWIFGRLGGEFIPRLDEGNLAFHILMKPGSSLDEAIKTSTRAEQIILNEFPEVTQALTRFGVAEVPTDPMPMDIGDTFVILKPKGEWTSADTKEELIEKMKTALAVIPGVEYEFSQPIEMRFNELLTGVREDVAIKLYGDDMNILAAKAQEITRLIANIPGIGDMKAESITGLPQITIRYQRDRMARHGLHIDDVNRLVESAFAGGTAGVIFEGERRFDLVVKYADNQRTDVEDLRRLRIPLPGGGQIPLTEVATINVESAPMQISRDNTNRRTYVGINVRGRDVKSLVEEIRDKLDAGLSLPTGYYIRYGGAFENLERASARLMIVVPMALALIFVLIYLALRSFRQTAIIYISIPLAAIGGVLALWLRDLPFSISAGVGFVVLFGISVLNGLILLNAFNDLKEEGVKDIKERIMTGTRHRVRPIMLTALTDIFGFMPMAISFSAGAEVQRPLATVVIGGILTTTFLTLIILPILYRWLEEREARHNALRAGSVMTLLCFMALPATLLAQTSGPVTSVEEAMRIGMESNASVHQARYQYDWYRAGKKAAFNPPKTEFSIEYGKMNGPDTDNGFSVTQEFAFPTLYMRQLSLANARIKSGEAGILVAENELRHDIRKQWFELAVLHENQAILLAQDSLYARFLRAAEIRLQTQETGRLEVLMAQTKRMEISNALRTNAADMIRVQETLGTLLGNTSLRFQPDIARFMGDIASNHLISENPDVLRARQEISVHEAARKTAAAEMMPDITIGYFSNTMIGTDTAHGVATLKDRFTGVQAGLRIPIFTRSGRAAITQAKIEQRMAESQAGFIELETESRLKSLMQTLEQTRIRLDELEQQGLPIAKQLLHDARMRFEQGDINYIEFVQAADQAHSLQLDYLAALRAYNEAAIERFYLIGQ